MHVARYACRTGHSWTSVEIGGDAVTAIRLQRQFAHPCRRCPEPASREPRRAASRRTQAPVVRSSRRTGAAGRGQRRRSAHSNRYRSSNEWPAPMGNGAVCATAPAPVHRSSNTIHVGDDDSAADTDRTGRRRMQDTVGRRRRIRQRHTAAEAIGRIVLRDARRRLAPNASVRAAPDSARRRWGARGRIAGGEEVELVGRGADHHRHLGRTPLGRARSCGSTGKRLRPRHRATQLFGADAVIEHRPAAAFRRQRTKALRRGRRDRRSLPRPRSAAGWSSPRPARSVLRPSSGPLWMIAALNRPFEPGATRWSHTDIPPADSPAIVTLSGSPRTRRCCLAPIAAPPAGRPAVIADVAGRAERRMRQETQAHQPVVDGHDDDVAAARQAPRVVDVAAAVDERRRRGSTPRPVAARPTAAASTR